MAFTRDEFGRGAFLSWGCFMAALLLGSAATMIFSAFGPEHPFKAAEVVQQAPFYVLMTVLLGVLLGGPVSLIAMVIGMPIAWLLGRSLRRVPTVGIHLTVYLLFGTIFGTLAFCVSSVVPGSPTADATGVAGVPWIAAVAATMAVPLGWWRTAHLALLEDRGLRVRRTRGRGDPDAPVEDAALDA